MHTLPVLIPTFFIFITALAITIFWYATNKSRRVLTVLLAWVVVQGLIATTGFYEVTNTMPPRFALLIGPPLLVILSLFLTRRGRHFLDSLQQPWLCLLHSVRAGVEMVLYALFLYKTVPVGMTFAGGNYDIVAGVTSILIFAFGYQRPLLGRGLLLTWNFISLALLLYIVRTGVLSAPTSFQRLAFDQPNIALFHFPFIWLPGCIVPLVLLSHLSTIRQLLRS